MSGHELAQEIIRRKPHLPVVLTTGYDGQSLSIPEGPALPLLRKPYRLDALESALALALRSRHAKQVGGWAVAIASLDGSAPILTAAAAPTGATASALVCR